MMDKEYAMIMGYTYYRDKTCDTCNAKLDSRQSYVIEYQERPWEYYCANCFEHKKMLMIKDGWYPENTRNLCNDY